MTLLARWAAPLLFLSCVAALATTFLLGSGGAPLQAGSTAPAAGPVLPNPILFVTQVPVAAGFTTIGATFGNHQAGLADVARGGDLWIRYGDGTLRNLTAAAGYGSSGAGGFQDENAIAVRDPAVHWNGEKAIFSMVIGAAEARYQVESYRWQLYEITGLGRNDTPVITKVPNQPHHYNNISPIYGTDGRIIFTTDHPRQDLAHLYPQRDEYELAPTVSGLWSLDPATGDLILLNHAPSGDFTPMIDSFGRVVFTQWDHLQRDQQADADAVSPSQPRGEYGTFDYLDESDGPPQFGTRVEIFPEPRGSRTDLLAGTNLAGHTFNHFFPWTITESGTDSEVLNHLGRHELHSYFPRALTDDPNLDDFYGQFSRTNPNSITNLFQIEEDPAHPGTYYGVDAPEFGTHAAGNIISLTAPVGLPAEQVKLHYVTFKNTDYQVELADPSGSYREPLPLSNGLLVAVNATTTEEESGGGGPNDSSYDFRLRSLTMAGNGFLAADQYLTGGISKTIRYWSPDNDIQWSGTLWELNPVEVVSRTVPSRFSPPLPAPEAAIFTELGIDPAALRDYLVDNNLALAVVRDTTTRDDFDIQQPYNLRVAGGAHETLGADFAGGEMIYDVAQLQLFQGDLVRGWTGGYSDTPNPGRRVLARTLHDPAALAANQLISGTAGAARIFADGSIAAFVPARRAMSWQLLDPGGTPVVRERYWVTFQPGEIRVCSSCHGLSDKDQAGAAEPQNSPQALRALLTAWVGDGPIPTPDASPEATPEETPEGTPVNTPNPAPTGTPSPLYLPAVIR